MDYQGLLVELYQHEVEYQQSKRHYLQIWMIVWEHCTDVDQQYQIAQLMINCMTHRVVVPLGKQPIDFLALYRLETQCWQVQRQLFQAVLTALLARSRNDADNLQTIPLVKKS